MKQKYKKQNCPRLANAIRRACEYAHSRSGWWYPFHSDYLGMLIYDFAYKADKYDVFNRLCPGVQTSVITFARGDIRHRKRIDIAEMLAMIAVVITAVILMLSPE